ncbi:DNA adenine methylase [Pseudomonas sp. RIT-PI-AD]|uniref:DNA adenine methylase n=1 Tax=Pseudomonas sp. RIT-PI-AD TaxID=3035294 RepID=UPI0021D95B9F|nr:DNA adenine methylase [Pseudomonas sp. RIT-PI-AD]
MTNIRYFTPLRYPGGKSKLCWLVSSIMAENNMRGGHYIEPYAGGAGIALELLLTDYVRHIHINDLNVGVFSFWDSVINNTEHLVGMIYDCKLDMETWHFQRKILQNSCDYNSLEIGFSFFYLNRTNRSGIINGGVIGGYNQKGNYKIDARFNKDALIDRIAAIAKKADQISLYNLDAETFLCNVDGMSLDKALIYIDPPYYVKGKRLYDNFYEPDDHKRISYLVRNIKTPWMLSYDDHLEIRKLYSRYRVTDVDLVYSAGTKMKGQEVAFFSDDIILPSNIQVA